jgi:antitoxin (DNA-binding transcriptional repressor) of toxin-antitoxin stability system
VKIVGVQEANLMDCVKDAQCERVILTHKGKPVALLVGVEGLDLEQLELEHSDELWSLLRARRAQKTISRAELEKRLAEP